VLRGKLAELLWSRRPEEQARASLRQEIHRLMETLEPMGAQILAITRDHLALRPGAVWVDVEEVLNASTTRPAALSLLDGELLEDLSGVDPSFDAWLSGERERLRDRARTLAESLLREKHEPEAVIPAAQQLLAIDCTHEGAWRALMRAYASRGERGMAIQAYERCRNVLAEQLDAQPSQETQTLLADIRAAGPIVVPAPLARPEPAAEPRHAARRESRLDHRGDTRFEQRGDARVSARGEPRQEPRGRGEARDIPMHGGPRIGVLPLQMIGTTEMEAHLSGGLADDITAGLARFRWMFLVSSAALGRHAAQNRDEAAIRRSFGVDFLLDGGVQRVGSRLRIALRLLDLRAGTQVVWSGRFERDLSDTLALQDEVAAEVVAQIEPEILLLEAQRIAARPPQDPTAYELMLRAISLITRLDRAVFQQAGELLAQAMAQAPDYASPYAWAAYWRLFRVSQGWADDPQGAAAEAGRLAERAIALDTQDARALTIAGHVRALLHHRPREALALHARALSLNPNLAMAWSLSGMAYLYLGELDEAERRMQRYKQLSPLDPMAFFCDTGRIMLAVLRGQYDLAAMIGREVSEMNPAFSDACKPYLAALGYLGADREAEMVRRRLLSIEPDFSIGGFLANTPLQHNDHLDIIVRGLRQAGVADGVAVVV
jgi:DNA-binding SARP family transcriptional activator/TolB-like protein